MSRSLNFWHSSTLRVRACMFLSHHYTSSAGTLAPTPKRLLCTSWALTNGKKHVAKPVKRPTISQRSCSKSMLVVKHARATFLSRRIRLMHCSVPPSPLRKLPTKKRLFALFLKICTALESWTGLSAVMSVLVKPKSHCAQPSSQLATKNRSPY